MKSIKSNIFWNMLRVGSNLLFPLITFPYASRILGPESIGLFNYIWAITSYFTLFASFGFPIYGMREVAVVKDNPLKLGRTVNSIFTVCLLFALIATASYLILCKFILPENFFLAAIIGISILLNSISFEWFFQGIEDFRYLTLRGLFIKCISLCCLFIFVKNANDLIAYAILNIAATCGNNFLNLFRIKKYISLAIQFADVFKHIRGASILFGGTIAISFYSYMNDILVGAMADMQSVGFFSTSNKIIHILLSVIGAITVSIVPRMSHLVGIGDKKESTKLQRNTLNLIFHVIIPIFVGLIILSHPIIELFAGEKFLAAVPALRTLSALILIIPLSSFLGNQVLIPHRKEKYGNYAVISGAVVNVCLAFLLVPHISFMGVAISLVFAEFVVTIVHFIYARKYMELGTSDFLPIRVIIASVTMGIIISLLYSANSTPGLSIIWAFVGMMVYFMALLIMKDNFIFNALKTRFSKR